MNPIQLFLVRIWQEQREFRASVRPVDEGDAMLFTEPAEMLEFLRASCDTLAQEPDDKAE